MQASGGIAVVVTLEEARRMLGYGRVTLIHRRDEYVSKPFEFVIFSALPEEEELSSVDLYFNEAFDTVDIVSFGHWHGHFDTAVDENENIRRAFKSARELILRRVHIIEQYTRVGKYLGSDGYRPGQPLPLLLRNAEYAQRLVFGKKPQRLTLPKQDND